MLLIYIFAVYAAVISAAMTTTLRQMARAWIYCAVAFIIGLAVYALLAPWAYMERGYFDFGGELLAAVAVAGVVVPLIIRRDRKICAWVRRASNRSGNKSASRYN